MVNNKILQKTIDYYDRTGKEWAENHSPESWYAKEINDFREYLPEGKILEIGCGPGRDAAELIRNNYEYVGIDASEVLVEIAKRRNPKGSFYKMRADELNFPANSFDGFWTNAVLLHIPKNGIDEVLQKIKTVCQKGGVGFIAVRQGEGESEDLKTGRWFAL